MGKMVKRSNEIKGEQPTVVSRHGGGGSAAGHSHGSGTRSPFNNVVPLYVAGGGAAANNRHRHGGTSGGALNCKRFGHLVYIVLVVLILLCII